MLFCIFSRQLYLMLFIRNMVQCYYRRGRIIYDKNLSFQRKFFLYNVMNEISDIKTRKRDLIFWRFH